MHGEQGMSHASTSPDGLEGVAGGWTGEEASGLQNLLESTQERQVITTAEIMGALWYHVSGSALIDELEIAVEDAAPGEIQARVIDALLVQKQVRTAIEVKISRLDFRNDTDAKRRPWMEVTHRFVYVVPHGLIKPSEVPSNCGLWYIKRLGPKKFKVSVVKRATHNEEPKPLPEKIMTAIMHRATRQPRIVAEWAKVAAVEVKPDAYKREYGRNSVMTTQRLPAPLVEAVRRKAGATPWTTVVERALTRWVVLGGRES
jgi:hypothetical protein